MFGKAHRAVATLGLVVWAGLTVACSSAVGEINQRAMMLHSKVAEGPQDPSLDWGVSKPTEYRIGPRDLLEIDIYELEEPNKSKVIKTRVSQFGTIILPLIGVAHAAGRTAAELQSEIEKRLAADYIINPTANVVVAEYMSRRITVLGSVESPGAFHLRENSTTLVDALALAGGPTEKAGTTVYVVRSVPSTHTEDLGAGKKVVNASSAGTLRRRLVKVDLDELIERGNPAANCALADGDVVHVPAAKSIFVSGKVKKGGSFALRGKITLLRAIALAGGLEDEASPSLTVLIRTTDDGPQTIPVDLTQIEAGSEADLLMQPDDVLVISESKTSMVLRGVGNFFRGLFHFGYAL